MLSRQRLIDEVDLDRIGKANPALDAEKLRWLSGQHFRTSSIDDLMAALESRLGNRFELDASVTRPLAEVLRDRILVLSDADAVGELVLPTPDHAAPEAREAFAEPTSVAVLGAVRDAWSSIDDWTRDSLREMLVEAGAAVGVKGRQLYHPVRAALTGAVQGPDVPDVAYILGPERSLERLGTGREAAVESRA